MLCKKCGTRMANIDRVYAENNEIYRKYRCPSCSELLYTVEFPVDYDKNVKKTWNTFHRSTIRKKSKKEA